MIWLFLILVLILLVVAYLLFAAGRVAARRLPEPDEAKAHLSRVGEVVAEKAGQADPSENKKLQQAEAMGQAEATRVSKPEGGVPMPEAPTQSAQASKKMKTDE